MPIHRLPVFLIFAVMFFLFLPAWAGAEEIAQEDGKRSGLVLGSFSLVDMRPAGQGDWQGTQLKWGAESIDDSTASASGASFGYIGLQWELRIGEDWTAYAAVAPGLAHAGDFTGTSGGLNLRAAVGAGYAFDNGWRVGLEVPGSTGDWQSYEAPDVESVLINLAVPFD